MAYQEAVSDLDVGRENGQRDHATAVTTLPRRLVPARRSIGTAVYARARKRAHRWPLSMESMVVMALVLVVFTVHGWNIVGYPSAGDDEGTYLSQAWAVQQGLGLAHYTYWYDHPPLGWIQIAALSWVPALFYPDKPAVPYGRMIMPYVTAVSAVLLYMVARRLSMRPWAATLAVLLFVLSPLSVTMHRQIYLDNIAVPWMLGAFVLALSLRRHLWHHAAAGCCAAVSVLSKETMLLAVAGVLIALWRGGHPTTRMFSMAAFACGFVLIGVVYPLYAVLKGELMPGEGHVSLVGAVLFQVHDRAGSGSITTAGSGANDLLHAWLYYDSVLVVGGVIAVMTGLFVRRLRAPAVAGLAFVLVALRPGGYLPAMYIIQALPFFALTLAGLVALVGTRLLSGQLNIRAPARLNLRAWRPNLPAAKQLRFATAVVAAGLALAIVVPRWVDGDRRAMTSQDNRVYTAASAWLRANVREPEHSRIVVDDVLWLDAVRAGFAPGLGAIWFYKLDLDPAVQQALPGGWRDIDYVVSSPIIRQDPNGLPTVADLLTHSRVVATFGEGDGRIEIRRVIEEGS